MQHKNRYWLVILASVILVRTCIGLIWASAGPLLPLMMGEFNLGRGTVGWFASIAPITIAAVSVPLGILGSRLSLKKTFAVGAILQAGGILAPVCNTFVPILLTRMAFAVGTAITVPMATAIAAEWVTSRRLPIVNGITMSFINLGNAVAFLLTVPIATAISWKAPMAVYGAFALTCAVGWIILGREKPKVYESTTSLDPPRPDLGFKKVLRQRSTILLALSVAGSWGLWNSLTSWLPSYYNEVFKMPLVEASSILAIITVGGTIACIAGGILPMRIGRRRPMLILSGSFMGLAALSAVFFNNPAIIFLSVGLFGLFGNLQNPSLFTIPMELPNMSLRSGIMVISVMQVGGNMGNFLSPLAVGYLTDLTGSYLPGFIIFALLSSTSLLAGLLLPETGPKAKTALQSTAHPLPLKQRL